MAKPSNHRIVKRSSVRSAGVGIAVFMCSLCMTCLCIWLLVLTMLVKNAITQKGQDDLDAAVGRIVRKTGAYYDLPMDCVVLKEIDSVFPCLSNDRRLDFLMWASHYFKDSSSICTYLIGVANKYNLTNEWRFLLEVKHDNSGDEETKALCATLLGLLTEKW